MTKTLLTLILIMCATVAQALPDYSNETLRYKVTYKWGLINKQAGHATLVIKDAGDSYRAHLYAASEPWADKFFCVRDTLNGIIAKEGFRPTFYEKIAHEGSEHKHDTVRFSYNGNSVTGSCTRRVVKDGELRVNQAITLNAEGITVDMLSSFYYMRSLPFNTWQPGTKHNINIFSGKRKELLSLRYRGVEKIELDGKEYFCFHITFIFTGEGGKKTSDDMDAWITADARRIPIQLEGKLTVGKVRCLLIQ